jgi:hypothetical protein
MPNGQCSARNNPGRGQQREHVEPLSIERAPSGPVGAEASVAELEAVYSLLRCPAPARL